MPQKKGYMLDQIKADKKRQKEFNKIQKAENKYQTADKQMKAIESLQMRILAKANLAGYTTKSKPVVRLGNTGKQRVASIIAAAAVGGGAIPGAIIGGSRAISAFKVDGQQVKIRKKGDGSTQLVNYRELNEAERRERRRNSRRG